VALRVLTWNLFHGRDFPPDPRLHTWRSRLLRITERNATHVQVNRDLFGEFSALLATGPWDVALLQECPPRWIADLADACDAGAHGVLTARNSLAALRAAIARHNPDLIASNEGGSNLTLVRSATGEIAARDEVELQPGPVPERRAMALTRVRLTSGSTAVCVANLHASTGAARRSLAEREILAAAERSVAWAGGDALVFGGDLNLAPAQTDVFTRLHDRFGLGAPSDPNAIDHLLARGLEVVDPPRPWPPERREIPHGDRAIRLSDHNPVQATFEVANLAPSAAEE
jgi:endonuclease/exonuclease/phosphatase family metal-dependent hydrolase